MSPTVLDPKDIAKPSVPRSTAPVPKTTHHPWAGTIHLPSAVLALVAVLMLLGIVLVAEHQRGKPAKTILPEQAARIPDRVSVCKTGPWGNLEYVDTYLEAPEEFLPTAQLETNVVRWYFSMPTKQAVRDFINQLPAPDSVRESLINDSRMNQWREWIEMRPSDEAIIALPPEARRKLYNYLQQYAENHIDVFGIPAETFDQQFANPTIPREIAALTRQLCYPHGRLLMFADTPTVAARLPDYHERAAYFKALSRKRTVFLRLHVLPDSNIDQLAAYWTRGNWGIDVRPVLDALKTIPGGARCDINNIFPPSPSGLLHTYPRPAVNEVDAHKDCHWTSFNFFRDPPDPRFTDPKFVAETLEREYYPIPGNPRFGDIVLFTRANGDTIHSALYLADDIVYTKNGRHYVQPWILMHLPDLVETFSSLLPPDEELRVRYFRSKVL